MGVEQSNNGSPLLTDRVKFDFSELDTGEVLPGYLPYDLPNASQVAEKFRRAIRRRGPTQIPLLSPACPFCQTRLKRVRKELRSGPEEDDDYWSAALEWCPRCRYWRWHHLNSMVYGSRGLMAMHEYESRASKLAEFQDQMPSGCIGEIATQLRQRPHFWHTIHPRSLEILVGEVITANFGPVDVQHIGGTNDGGVDLVWVQSDSERWLVQVKRRQHPDAGEGVSTVRNLLGAMLLDGATHGLVVSTADHFTYMAHRAVNRAHEVGCVVRLVDRAKLDRLLTPLLPSQPWQQLLEAEFPDFLPHFTPESARYSDPRQRELFPRRRRPPL